MTEKTKQLIAQFEQELDELPEEEQEQLGGLLLEKLRRHKRGKEDGDAEAYSSFRVLKDAQFSGRSDESTTYEQTMYGVDDDE